jgi:hypothetical protein
MLLCKLLKLLLLVKSGLTIFSVTSQKSLAENICSLLRYVQTPFCSSVSRAGRLNFSLCFGRRYGLLSWMFFIFINHSYHLYTVLSKLDFYCWIDTCMT